MGEVGNSLPHLYIRSQLLPKEVTMTMRKAQILTPLDAEAYIYDGHTLLGVIECDTEFIWHSMRVDCSRITTWQHWIIDGRDADDANSWAQFQLDRLASGMHPTYFAPAIEENN